MARPTNEQRILIAQRRTRVLAMRTEHVPYEDIAVQLGISVDLARKDYELARKQAAADFKAAVAEHRATELLKLDALEREAWKVLKAKHITVQQGRIVRDDDGETILDDAPVLQAIDRLERLMKRRAALLGLDAPVRVEVSAEVDEQIGALAAALAAGWENWNLPEKLKLLETLRQAKAARIPKDPAGWARAQHLFLWSLQLQVAASVAENKRTVVRSAAGIGKSYLSAVIVCWWVTTHPVNDVYVWTTAPGGDQVSGILWEDIRKLHKRLGLPGKIGLDNKWRIDGVLVASGRKPADKADGADDDPDTGQGFHRRYLLVVLDDAGGLDSWLWDAAENITTGDDCRILGTGNPDHAGSRFAQICDHPLWASFKASLFDSPNFTGEVIPDELRTVLTTRAWQEARLLDWGAKDRRYLSKVLAEFPSDHPDQVIPAAALAQCMIPEPRAAGELVPVELGVDVGGGSDLTVVRERRGMKAGRRWMYRGSDPEKNAQLVMDAIRATGAVSVKVDGNGVGHGLVGDLRGRIRRGDAGRDVAVHSVMVGGASSQPLIYGNLRAELWWVIGRESSQQGTWDLSGMDEAEKTRTELLLPRVEYDAKGRIFIESKDDVRSRSGGKSPDDADALLLAYYVPRDGQGSYWEALTSGKLG